MVLVKRLLWRCPALVSVVSVSFPSSWLLQYLTGLYLSSTCFFLFPFFFTCTCTASQPILVCCPCVLVPPGAVPMFSCMVKLVVSCGFVSVFSLCANTSEGKGSNVAVTSVYVPCLPCLVSLRVFLETLIHACSFMLCLHVLSIILWGRAFFTQE